VLVLAAAQIEQLAGNATLRGLRPMLQDLPDVDWIAHALNDAALGAMQRAAPCFDALVRSEHLAALETFVRRHPDLRVVVDHLAKPRPDRSDFNRWRDGLARPAQSDRVHCKLSG